MRIFYAYTDAIKAKNAYNHFTKKRYLAKVTKDGMITIEVLVSDDSEYTRCEILHDFRSLVKPDPVMIKEYPNR